MTRDEIMQIMLWHGLEQYQVESILQRIEKVAAEAARQERIKLQTEIAQWKNAAATAEKWRGIAISQDGDGRTVQQVQEEAARQEREACAQVCESERDEATTPSGALRAARCAAAIRARSQQ